jgi:hypothetical protein
MLGRVAQAPSIERLDAARAHRQRVQALRRRTMSSRLLCMHEWRMMSSARSRFCCAVVPAWLYCAHSVRTRPWSSRTYHTGCVRGGVWARARVCVCMCVCVCGGGAVVCVHVCVCVWGGAMVRAMHTSSHAGTRALSSPLTSCTMSLDSIAGAVGVSVRWRMTGVTVVQGWHWHTTWCERARHDTA